MNTSNRCRPLPTTVASFNCSPFDLNLSYFQHFTFQQRFICQPFIFQLFTFRDLHLSTFHSSTFQPFNLFFRAVHASHLPVLVVRNDIAKKLLETQQKHDVHKNNSITAILVREADVPSRVILRPIELNPYDM